MHAHLFVVHQISHPNTVHRRETDSLAINHTQLSICSRQSVWRQPGYYLQVQLNLAACMIVRIILRHSSTKMKFRNQSTRKNWSNLTCRLQVRWMPQGTKWRLTTATATEPSTRSFFQILMPA